MKLDFFTYNLELKNTFTISHGSRDFQETLIVALSDGIHTGYGEAAAISYYGVSTQEMIQQIKCIESLILENLYLKPEELWVITNPYLNKNSFAQCALDIAMHDLNGKRMGKPLYDLWNLNVENIPLTNYTIGIDSMEKMKQKIQEFPWPLYKIKLGTKNDVAIIRELRKYTDAIFRVDANGSWTAEECIQNSIELKELNVEFIEQPLPPKDLAGLAEVYKKSALPILADESCIVEEDVINCSKYFHGINIKLTKCGGITPALRMISKAKELGLKVMVGCMTESSVGISAIAQLLPLLDYVDMDGAMLLKNDIAKGVKFENFQIQYPIINGTGVELLDN
jgi:L-Ala-D/L-Glu epimerase